MNDTSMMEKVDSNTTPDSSDMCNNEFEDDQNADNQEDECVALANLIVNLKIDIDENIKIQKQLKRANASLTQELNECKSALAESNGIRDRCRSALHNQEIELEKYKKYKDCQTEKEELERKLKASLNRLAQQKLQTVEALKTHAYETFEYKEKHAEWQQQITQEITVLVKKLLIPLAKKTKENAYAFEFALKKEMFEDLEYVQSLKKEVDELQSDKNEFSNEYDLLLQECLTNNIMCAALSSMADIDEYSEMACRYMEKIKEYECLENELSIQKENVSKEVYIELLRNFAKLENT
ncbi:hypothetical protein Tco_0867612 [Tanacetum coccineum]